LIEDGVAHLARLVRAAEALNDLIQGGWIGHDVRAEEWQPPGAQLEHRTVSLYGLPLTRPEDEPRRPEDPLARPLDVPAPVHAEMTADDDATLEGQEQILAAGLDALQALAVDPLGDPKRGGSGVRGFRRDHLALEHSEALGGAMKTVALGHGA
jgi:hypothetical protein